MSDSENKVKNLTIEACKFAGRVLEEECVR